MPAFEVLGDGYRLSIDGLELVLTRVRRQRFELVGELAIVDGVGETLSEATFNVSDLRSRQALGTHLAGRHRGRTWPELLERFCQDVLRAERTGGAAIVLADHPLPTVERFHDVCGLLLPREHPTIAYGDGDSLKTYIAQFIGGTLQQRGIKVGYFDWELSADEQRARLGELFGDDLPRLVYVRCDRPLTSEIDRLRRIRREHALDFAIFDSIGFACDGPPEAAEVAGRYMQCVRQLGIGSLHLAHVNRSEHADAKPFGSVFWHNAARRTWHVKPVGSRVDEPDDEGEAVERVVGLHPRKGNLGRFGKSIGFRVTFHAGRAHVQRVSLASIPEAAPDLPLWQRMITALRSEPLTAATLAEELGAKVETIERIARRSKSLFTFVARPPDHVRRIALLDRSEEQ